MKTETQAILGKGEGGLMNFQRATTLREGDSGEQLPTPRNPTPIYAPCEMCMGSFRVALFIIKNLIQAKYHCQVKGVLMLAYSYTVISYSRENRLHHKHKE